MRSVISIFGVPQHGRQMSQSIEDLLRPHVLDTSLDAGYQAVEADQAREAADKRRLKSSLFVLSKADVLAAEDAIKVHLACSHKGFLIPRLQC